MPAPDLLAGLRQLRQNSRFRNIGLLGQPPGIDLPLGRVRTLRQHLHGFLDVLQPLGVLFQVVFTAQVFQAEIQRTPHAIQQRLKTLRPIFFDVLVRVLCARDLKHAYLDRAGAEQLQ